MNVNSLDARAFSARGGLGDGLANVLRSITGGLIQAQDNADARADRSAERDARRAERDQDRQRQDDERVWQHDRMDRVDARQGLSEALRQAYEYGVVPPRDEFVTRPGVEEQATWTAANAGASKRGLHDALTRAQIALAGDRGTAAAARASAATGKAPAFDRTKWKQVVTTTMDPDGNEVRETRWVPIDSPASVSPAPAVPAAEMSDTEAGAEGFTVYQPGLWSMLRRAVGLDGRTAPVAPPHAPAPAQPAQAQPDTFQRGAGGWATMAPSGIMGAAPAPAAPTAATAPVQSDPRAMAVQTIENEREALASMGLDAGVFLTPDVAAHRRVLAALPPDAQLRVIDALRMLQPLTGR